MFDFEGFVDEVLGNMDGVGELKKYLPQIKADTTSFLNEAKADIKSWTEQVAEGKMTKREYESAIGGIPASATFRLLTEAGLKQAAMDKIKKKVISIIIKAAIRTLLKGML